MSEFPEIAVPMWERLPSGLLVPSRIAGQARAQPLLPTDLPRDLMPPAQPLAILGELPSSADQFRARPNERELDLEPSTLAFLAEHAQGIPFEPGFLAVARLAAAIWHVPLDADAQLALAQDFFNGAPIVERLRLWMRGGDGRVLFSEQQFFVVQRLLLEHGRDCAVTDGMTEEEFARLRRLLLGAATIVDECHAGLEEVAELGDDMLAYLVQNGAYHSRPNMLNAFARAYSLFVERARAVEGGLPLDEWVAEDYPLSLEEQFAVGHALQAVARAIDDQVTPGQRSLVERDVLASTALRDRAGDVFGVIAATREWYREAFDGDESLTSVAWETTPFMQRPFLELSTGQFVLVSPRSIITWLGDGFYYRLLDAAQRRNTPARELSLAYTQFVGELLEGWALDLVRSAYPGGRPPGGGRVFGEQPYGDGRLTPDVAIDLGTDLVLIEVRSGYLNRRLRVTGDVDDFHRDLERVVLSKVRQLGNRISDLLAGDASLPDVDINHVAHVWPILVTADIAQTEPLLDLITAELPDVYHDHRVRSLLICDPEDLELLMGMVEKGHSLTAILDRREHGPFARLELKRWVFEDPGSPGEERPTFALYRWDRVATAVRDILQLEA